MLRHISKITVGFFMFVLVCLPSGAMAQPSVLHVTALSPAKIPSSERCPNCHGKVEADWIICGQCGAILKKGEFISELTAEWLRSATSIEDIFERELVQSDIAEFIAGTDLQRAIEVVNSISDSDCKALALRSVISVLARREPQTAIQLANELTSPEQKALALVNIAKVLPTTDLNKAKDLYERAYYISIEDRFKRPLNALELRDVIKGGPGYVSAIYEMARLDADRALRLAEDIRFKSRREQVLSSAVSGMAVTDAKRALALAINIQDRSYREEALGSVASALAKQDTKLALQVANNLSDTAPVFGNRGPTRSTLLLHLVRILADTASEQALFIADTIPNIGYRAEAYESIARSQHDPQRALQIADKIQVTRNRLSTYGSMALSLMKSNPVQAKVLCERALLSYSSQDEVKPRDIEDIALVLANTDTQRGIAIIRSAQPNQKKANHDVATDGKGFAPYPDAQTKRESAADLLNLSKYFDDEAIDFSLEFVAIRMAETDISRALEIARSIQDDSEKAATLAALAGLYAKTDPKQATVLRKQVLRMAMNVPDERKASLYRCIAEDFARQDSGWALQAARSLSDKKSRSEALGSIVKVLSGTSGSKLGP